MSDHANAHSENIRTTKMNNAKSWKQRKRTGVIKRKLSKEYVKGLMKRSSATVDMHKGIFLHQPNISQMSVPISCNEGSVHLMDSESDQLGNTIQNASDGESFESNSIDEDYFIQKNISFRDDIKKWAIERNIAQEALRELVEILNNRFSNILPKDPRVILGTARKIIIKSIEPDGEYWHNGLIPSLTLFLNNWKDVSNVTNIRLNINFDGLPIFKSSKKEFWPILCNVFENPTAHPFIIGVYYGVGKPKNLDIYLEDFVTEMKELLNDGICLSSNKTITVKIRCFICDSPARAFMKGVCNFNGKHGCLKCVTVGEYSHTSHTVVFPEMKCSKRTDDGFRKKLYGAHHKYDSPLLQLPIDMVNDFPVADSLHLIDLGIMKRLLVGWRDGNFGKYITKWSAKDIDTVNTFLRSCVLPSEIHRCVRELDCLAHWKASEYRSFFFYLSCVIIPDVLSLNAVSHFLFLYCAITICSCEKYKHLLPLSKELLQYFVEHYKDFYGPDYVTSNVHNLLHVTDEVQRFGPLSTFNAYPFENKLHLIKKMLRTGTKPLSQVAKRLSEYLIADDKDKKERDVPFVTKNSKNVTKMIFKEFILTAKSKDKYFMTNNHEIIEVKSIHKDNLINGYKITDLTDVFDYPVKSSIFDIFKAKLPSVQRIEKKIHPSDVKFKYVWIEHKNELYFIPLLHTV